LTATSSAGVNLAGNNFVITGDLITTNSGPFIISNIGTLTLVAGANTSISGPFVQSGGGGVSLSGTILTINHPISFENSITLTSDATLSNSSGVGNITLSNIVNGPQNLTIIGGSGDISLNGNIGFLNRIGAFRIVSGANISYQGLKARSIVQEASSGITLISGLLNTSSIAGISITGGVITQNGSLTTTNLGPIFISNTGTFMQGGSINASGSITQIGGGDVFLSGSITNTGQNILFTNRKINFFFKYKKYL
jgi:hypothetical protein